MSSHKLSAGGGVTYLLGHTRCGPVERAAHTPSSPWERLVRSPFDNEMARSRERPQFSLVIGTHPLVRGLFFGRGAAMRNSRPQRVAVLMPGRTDRGDGR